MGRKEWGWRAWGHLEICVFLPHALASPPPGKFLQTLCTPSQTYSWQVSRNLTAKEHEDKGTTISGTIKILSIHSRFLSAFFVGVGLDRFLGRGACSLECEPLQSPPAEGGQTNSATRHPKQVPSPYAKPPPKRLLCETHPFSTSVLHWCMHSH